MRLVSARGQPLSIGVVAGPMAVVVNEGKRIVEIRAQNAQLNALIRSLASAPCWTVHDPALIEHAEVGAIRLVPDDYDPHRAFLVGQSAVVVKIVHLGRAD